MTPQELWDAFEEAFSKCPSHRTFDDDQHEMGQPGNYGKLKKKYRTVIDYWLDCDSIGGNALLVNGYIACVDETVLKMVKDYQSQVKKAKKKIVKEVFGV